MGKEKLKKNRFIRIVPCCSSFSVFRMFFFTLQLFDYMDAYHPTHPIVLHSNVDIKTHFQYPIFLLNIFIYYSPKHSAISSYVFFCKSIKILQLIHMTSVFYFSLSNMRELFYAGIYYYRGVFYCL